MPLIRSFTLKRCTLLTLFISLNGEIISPYSCYAKKGLVYIIIISPFNYQPPSYSKYTKANTRLAYNMRLISFNKYKFPHRCAYLCVYYSL